MEENQAVTSQSGILGKTIDWITHASFSQGTKLEWAVGLAFLLILAFGWSTVVKGLLD